MKKLILWVLPVLLLCGAPMHAMANTANAKGTEVTINLEDLPTHMVTQVMDAKRKSDEAAAELEAAAVSKTEEVVEVIKSTDPEELKKWLDVVGASLKNFCKALGMGVNEFLKTPAGLLIAGIAVLNYGGMEVVDAVVSIVLCTAVWLIFNVIWIWSFRRSHFQRVSRSWKPWDTNPPVTIEPAYSEINDKGENDGGARGVSMVIHGIVWLLVSAVCSMTAFSGW